MLGTRPIQFGAIVHYLINENCLKMASYKHFYSFPAGCVLKLSLNKMCKNACVAKIADYAHSGPLWPPKQPFFDAFDLRIALYRSKNIGVSAML